MYRIKQDQRTIRSCRLIYDALATLIHKKPFSKITVTEVVETAQVGRTTFYRCFDEIEDVLRMRCDQVFDELVAYIVAYRKEDRTLKRGVLLKPMLRYFYLNSDIIDLLLRAQRIDILQTTFRQKATAFRAEAATQFQLPEAMVAYIVAIRVSVMTTVLVQWVETGKRESPDELAEKILSMMESMMTIDQLL